jgi:hypothetical protein
MSYKGKLIFSPEVLKDLLQIPDKVSITYVGIENNTGDVCLICESDEKATEYLYLYSDGAYLCEKRIKPKSYALFVE